MVQIWSEVSEKEPSQAYDISDEVLWNNCIITFDGESLFDENFIAKGMLTIQDITSENGSLLSWEEGKHKFLLNKSPKGTNVCANKIALGHLDPLSILVDCSQHISYRFPYNHIKEPQIPIQQSFAVE